MTDFELILENTLGNFESQAKCLVEDDSDTAIKFKVIASEILHLYEKLAFCNKQMFPNTADGEYLEKHGGIRGIYKKRASKSTGKVIFKCKSAVTSTILIPKGTLCTSSKGSGLMFETVTDVTIKKDATYALADVQSTVAGSHTNIAPYHIDVLVTAIAGVSSIENTEKTSGGADDEPDDMFRERVIEAFNKISNGANLGYYEQFAKSKPNIWHSKAMFTPNKSNEVELYVENRTHTLSDGVITDLQTEIETVRTLGMKVTVKHPVKKPIAINVTAKVVNMANELTYRTAIFDVLEDTISLLKIGQRYSPAKVAQKLLELDGITDISITNPTQPVPIAYNQIAELGQVVITIEGETQV
ncbi:MAG: baseplate J/gp47 family protein [Oscillospiraceae bacterium]